MQLRSSYAVLLFFQAEDGIRDGHVTGVQTCALPISTAALSILDRDELAAVLAHESAHLRQRHHLIRSEERRVGKEGTSRGSPSHGGRSKGYWRRARRARRRGKVGDRWASKKLTHVIV